MKMFGAVIAAAAALSLAGTGYASAQLVMHNVLATETSDPGAMTSATDSVVGPICATANEDITACFGPNFAYQVPLAYVTGFGTEGVNLCDSFANCDTTNGRDPTNTISDQLYLSVQRVLDDTGATVAALISWCWDSDLEPNVNICQDQINPSLSDLALVLEPPSGPTNVTADLPLLNQRLWSVNAISEVPESSTWAMLMLGFAGYRARRSHAFAG